MIRPPVENVSAVAKKAKAAMVAKQQPRTAENYQDQIKKMAANRLAR